MAGQDEKVTPAMRQFHRFKEKYPDAVLFFRMGDFYETFYEDARICSRVLGLALTSRSKGTNPIPLAGVPYHAVDNYLKKMLQAGYKVAVCEQVEDPKQAKGVVKRDVVRVVTPGTLTDDMLLDAREDNFLASVSVGPKRSAIAWVDISTGHFFLQEVSANQIVDELLRLGPREVLLPETGNELFAAESRKLAEQIGSLTGALITERPGWYFDPHTTRSKLLRHFGTVTLEGFGIADNDQGVCAAGAILEYLNETQKTALNHIRSIRKVSRTEFLQIDQTSLRSLEVLRTLRTESAKGTLLDCLDETLTGMGARMLRAWLCMPLCDVEAIRLRQEAVDEFMQDDSVCNHVRETLKGIADLERIVARISTFRAGPKDLVSLGLTLKQIPALRELLAPCKASLLSELSQQCDSIDELAELLESAIDPECPSHLRDGGVIRSGFHAELDRLRGIGKDGRSWLAEYQQKEIERTGISNLKIGYNKVFGFYIEISRALADEVPAHYVRKQTIKNAERYITEELKDYETEVLGAQDKALALEQKLFEEVRVEAARYIPRLQSLAQAIATIDCLVCFGCLARQRGYKRPAVTDGKELIIREGRHPVLAEAMGNEFVPNDVALGDDSGDLIIITGPNMAGKSTYIRQVALLALMAQTGSFIPVEEATIGLIDRIFTRVGASDELLRGQSTFMVEMTETANIVNNATNRSLVVLDEVGRGTSTYDGLSLAWAITEHIANHVRCRTLFATHYHQLTELGQMLVNVKNCNVAVREWQGSVVFLHKILP
ncbi:MAG: DNA mismatch repair protein MutS, partial [Sedimentisphaerales bacterium]|nr:DNA mismatch repair protein MutS [Sedimentisphaerales bacterium]